MTNLDNMLKSRDTYDSNVGAFHIVPEVSEVVLISFDSFFFFPLCFSKLF